MREPEYEVTITEEAMDALLKHEYCRLGIFRSAATSIGVASPGLKLNQDLHYRATLNTSSAHPITDPKTQGLIETRLFKTLLIKSDAFTVTPEEVLEYGIFDELQKSIDWTQPLDPQLYKLFKLTEEEIAAGEGR